MCGWDILKRNSGLLQERKYKVDGLKVRKQITSILSEITGVEVMPQKAVCHLGCSTRDWSTFIRRVGQVISVDVAKLEYVLQTLPTEKEVMCSDLVDRVIDCTY